VAVVVVVVVAAVVSRERRAHRRRPPARPSSQPTDDKSIATVVEGFQRINEQAAADGGRQCSSTVSAQLCCKALQR
jgi:hypothetical protein